MLFFDSHCHLDETAFDADRAEVLARAVAAHVTQLVNPSYDMDSSRRVTLQSRVNSQLHAAVGVHPNNLACLTDQALVELHVLAGDPNVVAIGEIGLDYYWKTYSVDEQRAGFVEQLKLAHDVDLPVIVHCRDAYDDMLDVLQEAQPGVPVVLHAFAGTGAHAERALNAGYYLGIGGPVTYKKAVSLRDVVRDAPRDRILLETDAPFLSPEPYRGKRNEPAHLVLSAHMLADTWCTSVDEVALTTTRNALHFFRIKI